MQKLFFIIIFAKVISTFVSSCSSVSPSPTEKKPESVIAPIGVLGAVSEVRKKILQNTLNEAVSEVFRVVPQERFEEAQEKAFQELVKE